MYEKSNKNSKMTIDKLAIMVAKGFENTATKADIEGIIKRIDGLKINLKTRIKE